MKRTCLYFLFCILGIAYCSVISAKNTTYTFIDSQENYQYSVRQTGENFTFKFAKNPQDRLTKVKAGRHVLLSVYKDDSINKNYTESYTRERARCFVFDSDFYTYSLCFLPNDFDTKNKDRFWGFVTQMPNWKWLVTRFLFPVFLAFALFLYAGRRQKL
ncbi:MAG: hypothetical protein GQ583_01245 [Methyloprofundus sp.]|nr:hypothetical protein [Methyloprofundus sp.]